ncbi:MAG: Yip1 family protein [Methanospirillum sp.]
MALSLTDKIVGFIVRPVETFRAVRDEELGPPVIYWIVLLIINAILTAIIAYLGFTAAAQNSAYNLGMSGSAGAFIAGLIAAIIIGIIGLILWSVFLHIGAKIMGGRGDFADSFKSAVYAQTPSLLLGWIPIISIIFTLWAIVLLFLGVRELHEMDTMRAVIAVVIAVVLYIIVIAILALLGLAVLGGIAGLASVPGVTSPT